MKCWTKLSSVHFYFGNNWIDKVNPTPSALAYVDRIHLVAKEFPELLVGHHYTRYIGDLSGGQILKKIAQKAMNLSEHDGLRFYEFDSIDVLVNALRQIDLSEPINPEKDNFQKLKMTS